MSILARFTKLMKRKPVGIGRAKRNSNWIIDERKCLSLTEVEKLLLSSRKLKEVGVLKGRFSQIRDWFLIELGLNSGLRVSEMASLKHGDLLVNDGKCSLVVVGKGQKRRVVWLSSIFKSMHNKYEQLKREFGFEPTENSYVLNNLQDARISKRALQKTFKKLLSEAGISSHYSIHCLRHTYATFLLRSSGQNYRFVQKQLGHASIRTTQVYAGIVETDARQALERLYK